MAYRVSDHTRFTAGDCGILARAIHKRTGWPICTFTDYLGRPDRHAFVKRPDGVFLDVEGIADEVEMRLRWHAQELALQEFNSYKELTDKDPRWVPTIFGNYSYLRAHHLAGKLVEQHQDGFLTCGLQEGLLD